MRTAAFIVAASITGCWAQDNEPSAIVIPASQYFEGNDGSWSTFDLRVGAPEQFLRVLVSTASPHAILPLSEYACSPGQFNGSVVPPDCAVSRGNLFTPNTSSTYVDGGTYGINQNGVGLGANLGYYQEAQFGLEKVGIGLNGPTLVNQTIAGIATHSPFYHGVIGLNNQPVNFSTLGNYSAPSLVTTLKQQRTIPSVSWSYTAGAKYRLKQVNGQLVFSGYDTSRFTANAATFTMAEDVTRDLVVALQSISYSGTTSATLLSRSINVMIDSTDSNIWLPKEACDAFEKAFGLTFDNNAGMYVVNETQHNALLNSNSEVTFRISDTKSGGEAVRIVLPYAAFDLTAKYPLVKNTTYYFPIKRAANESQYVLGRTFLQESYLSVDYERKTFNVSACSWTEGAQQNIVTITAKDPLPGTNGGAGGGGGGSSLSGGAIAGIVVGAVLGALLIAGIFAVFLLRKRRKWMRKGYTVDAPHPIDPSPEFLATAPVLNSHTTSSSAAYSKGSKRVPESAADISAQTSTIGNSRSATGSSPSGVAQILPLPGGGNVTVPGEPELDGHPVAENPGVYELPGFTVAGGGTSRIGGNVDSMDEVRRPSEPVSGVSGETPSPESRSSSRPASPFVSTMGTDWNGNPHFSDGGERPVSHLVSPTTPTRREGDQL